MEGGRGEDVIQRGEGRGCGRREGRGCDSKGGGERVWKEGWHWK